MANLNLSQFGENTSVSDADYTFVWDSANSISKKVSRNSWLNSGTLTSSAPVTISQTWGTTGTYTAFKVVANETATATAASNLLELWSGSTAELKFYVSKGGSLSFRAGANFGSISTDGTGRILLNSSSSAGARVSGDLHIGSNDTILVRDSPSGNTLALRNGTAAQTFRVYNTYTDASNYERGIISWESNELNIRSEKAGSGQFRNIIINAAAGLKVFLNNSTIGFQYTTAGHLLYNNDNLNDIGASGANRPRNVYVGSSIVLGTATFNANGFTFPNKFIISESGADGRIAFYNGSGGAISRLQLGGVTDTFPAIAPDGAGIKFTGAAAGSTSWIKVPPVAVGSLPLANTAGAGARAFVNDALAPTFGNAVTGGGAVLVPVYSDGSTWNVG